LQALGLYYLENYVWTYDEHEREEPKKKLFHGNNIVDPKTAALRAMDGNEDDSCVSLRWSGCRAAAADPEVPSAALSHLMMGLHGWLAQSTSHSASRFNRKAGGRGRSADAAGRRC
jgi:hypothetical protein